MSETQNDSLEEQADRMIQGGRVPGAPGEIEPTRTFEYGHTRRPSSYEKARRSTKRSGSYDAEVEETRQGLRKAHRSQLALDDQAAKIATRAAYAAAMDSGRHEEEERAALNGRFGPMTNCLRRLSHMCLGEGRKPCSGGLHGTRQGSDLRRLYQFEAHMATGEQLRGSSNSA